MAVYENIMYEIYDYLLKKIDVSVINDLQSSYSVVWDFVRDEYEQSYGKDELYDKIWLDGNYIQKLFLVEIRRYPETKKFLEKLFSFTRKTLGENTNTEACKNFLIILFKNLLTSREFSEKMIEIIRDIENDEEIVKVISSNDNDYEQIDDNTLSNNINDDNKGYISNYDIIDIYADNYTEVMFMQKKNEVQITLKDIYIENEFEHIVGSRNTESLLEYIKNFCADKEKGPILFIEGHAGIGKSSLISRIAYEYRESQKFFDNKMLAIIQLRNLVNDDEKLNVHNPWSDFKNYLNFDGGIKQFMDLMDDAVLILDGFDELCLMDDIRLDNKLKYVSNMVLMLKDYHSNCKMIMTTRPNYLARLSEWHKIYQVPNVIMLNHFSNAKRIKWIKAAKKAGLKINKDVERSVTSIIKNDIEVVASTPLTLYLIVHENILISKNDELWSVYEKIFGEEMIRKRYDHINLDGEVVSHPGECISTLIYKITIEIAYYMFRKSKMDVFSNEIEELIERLFNREKTYKYELDKDEIKDILKDSYALFNYYKENGYGGVSFYHNYIREFFLQEKISFKLNEIYLNMLTKYNSRKDTSNLKIMLADLYTLLQYGRLSDKTLDFISSYGKVFRENAGMWINIENQYHFLRDIITDILITDELKNSNENFFINLWALINVVNKNSNAEDYNVFDTSRIKQINENNHLIKYLEIVSKSMSIYKIDFSGVNWVGKTIHNITFEYCKFEDAIMSGVKMNNVTFDNCVLNNCVLNGTNLDNVSFIQSNLNVASFSGSLIVRSMFVNTSMNMSNLFGVTIRNSNIKKSNIVESQLFGVKIKKTKIDMTEKALENEKFVILDSIEWEEN